MLFKRMSRANPEKIFMVVKNSYSTASLTNGQVVQWDYQSEKDGVSVTIPSGMASNFGNAAAGVVAETIVFGDYGLVQVYGYHSAVRARRETNDAIAAGSGIRLPLAAGVFCAEAEDVDGTLNYDNMGFSFDAYTLWTTTTIAAFIKAM